MRKIQLLNSLLLILLLTSCGDSSDSTTSFVPGPGPNQGGNNTVKVDTKKFKSWKSSLIKSCNSFEAIGIEDDIKSIEKGIDIGLFKKTVEDNGGKWINANTLETTDYYIVFTPEMEGVFSSKNSFSINTSVFKLKKSSHLCRVSFNKQVQFEDHIVPTLGVLAVVPKKAKDFERLLNENTPNAMNRKALFKIAMKGLLDNTILSDISDEKFSSTSSNGVGKGCKNKKTFFMNLSRYSDTGKWSCRLSKYKTQLDLNQEGKITLNVKRTQGETSLDFPTEIETKNLVPLDNDDFILKMTRYLSRIHVGTETKIEVKYFLGSLYKVNVLINDSSVLCEYFSRGSKGLNVSDAIDNEVSVSQDTFDSTYFQSSIKNCGGLSAAGVIKINGESEIQVIKNLLKL